MFWGDPKSYVFKTWSSLQCSEAGIWRNNWIIVELHQWVHNWLNYAEMVETVKAGACLKKVGPWGIPSENTCCFWSPAQTLFSGHHEMVNLFCLHGCYDVLPHHKQLSWSYLTIARVFEIEILNKIFLFRFLLFVLVWFCHLCLS